MGWARARRCERSTMPAAATSSWRSGRKSRRSDPYRRTRHCRCFTVSAPMTCRPRCNSTARPVLNTAEQVARWKQAAPHRACDVMIDTGMNRLGLRPEEVAVLDGLSIETLHTHLACADEDHELNGRQLQRFREVASSVPAKRYSMANSAGIFLGRDYSFDLVRPGLALYGGIPRPEAQATIRQVAHVEAQVVQRRTIRAGKVAAMERPSLQGRTPRPRSSTSAMRMATCADSPRRAPPSWASMRCRCSAASRWT